MSSELRKNNIQIKNNNDVLNRLTKLNIYSYVLNDVPDKTVIGLVINEELYNNFRNVIINNIPKDIKTERIIKKYSELTNKEKYDLSVDYNVLLCYFIIAFQEFYKKYNDFYKKQEELNKKYNDFNEKQEDFNKKYNDFNEKQEEFNKKQEDFNKKQEELNNKYEELFNKFNIK